MKRLLKIAFIVAAVLVVLAVGIGIAATVYLGGSEKDIAAALEKRLQVKVDIEDVSFSIGQLLLLQPTISLSGLSVGNPQGYSSEALLQASGISAQVELASLFGEAIRIPRVTLHRPQVVIERDARNRTNLQVLLGRLDSGREPAGEATAAEPGRSIRIDEIRLDSGSLQMIDSGSRSPTATIDDIDLELHDLAPGQAVRVKVEARLFEGRDSRLSFEGESGPVKPDSIASSGNLTIEVALADVSEDLRRQLAGNLLRSPTRSSRIRLQVALSGDVMSRLSGKGELTFSELALGKAEDRTLPLEGQVPLELRISQALARPVLRLTVPQGKLSLGQASWQGQFQIEKNGPRLQGQSRGELKGIDLNQMLSSFTTNEEKFFGQAQVRNYSLRFAGNDAQQIMASLSGDGNLTLKDCKFQGIDVVGKLRQRLRSSSSGEGQEQSADEKPADTIDIATSFRIENRRFITPDLKVSGALDATGKGYFSFDKELNFDIDVDVKDSATLSGFLASGSVPVRIRGNTEAPRVEPDVARLATDAIPSLLERLLGGGKKKDSEEKKKPDTKNQP